jgi:hypothetical protein
MTVELIANFGEEFMIATLFIPSLYDEASTYYKLIIIQFSYPLWCMDCSSEHSSH